MMKRIPLFLALLFASLGQAHSDSLLRVISHASAPGVKFTENLGQWDQRILFRARLDGGALYVERNCLTFSFYEKKKARSLHHGGLKNKALKDLNIRSHAYRVHFDNCNPVRDVVKQQEGTDYENYYIGNDETKWKSNVRNYRQLFLKELYNGIDYELVTATNGLKYNFHVRAGADPSQIRMTYEGATKVYLEKEKLHITLEVTEGLEYKPFAYQMIGGTIVEVPCRYKLENNTLRFEFPRGYDRRHELVIDPVLVFAAQSGSPADNFGMTATFDPQGNLYSGGTVFDSGYPTTTGVFSSSFNGPAYYGNSDVFITKYSSNGTSLIYSTYLGGNYSETVNSMIVDMNNNLCFFGVTSSANFPVTNNCYDNSFNGGEYIFFVLNGQRFEYGTDIYVAKLNANGTALIGSTFLGGNKNDGLNYTNHAGATYPVPAVPPSSATILVDEPAYDSLQFNYGDQCRGEIQVDVSNNIYIASSTRSSNFPVTGAFDNSLGGKQDGIIAKFNSNLTALQYASFIGGSRNDAAYGLIVLSNLEAYVTGGTCSNDIPIPSGGYAQTYQGGKSDGFIVRVNASGNALINGTYFGTTNYDQSFFIQADKYRNIYIYGQSLGSVPIIVAPGSTSIFNVPNTHQFIARFNSTLNTLNMCTKFGAYTNNVDISPAAFAVDKCNNIYLSGWGGNILNNNNPMGGMPLFQPTQSTTDGNDFYFMGLDSNAAAIKYGSYFGGSLSDEHVDGGTSRFDPMGRIYQSVCAGCGGNDDFPVTPGAWPKTPGNPNHNSTNCNNGVVKLDFQLQLVVATISTGTLSGCPPLSITFTNATPPQGSSSTYTWHLGNGITSQNPNPTMTFTNPGTYTVSLVIFDNLTCNKRDSAVTYINVYPKPVSNIAVQSSPCSNSIVATHTTNGTLGSNPFAWYFGNGSPVNTQSSPVYTYPSGGTYPVTFTVTDVNGCKDVQTTTVSVFNFQPSATGAASLCSGNTVTLTASGGTSYTWSPGGSNNSNIFVTPPSTTIYSVLVLHTANGANCTRTFTLPVVIKPGPLAAFTPSMSPCTNTVTFINNSTGSLPPGPYTWFFGDNSPSSSSTSPVHVYQANGAFNVTLSVTDVNGCTSVKVASVSVFNFAPAVTPSGSLCSGGSLNLQASGGTGYTWTPSTALSNSLIPNPVVNPTLTTQYVVEIENTSPGYRCAATLSTQVLVHPTPTAAFTFSTNECGGGVYYTDQSEADIASWSWSLAPAVTRTIQHPYYFYPKGGTFTVSLRVTNEAGCSNVTERGLTVPVPPPVAVSSDTDVCIGDKVQLSASGGISYEWSPPATLDFPTIATPMAAPVARTEYSVDITTSVTVNGANCRFLLVTQVEAWRLSSVPVSAVARPKVITVGNAATLNYIGDPGANVIWLPVNTTTPGAGYTVTAKPVMPITYTAIASRGPCAQTMEVHVDAFTEGCLTKDVFVPNTFTPNEDGNNDRFYVRGLKIDEVYFAVYNRWGELVFETNEKEKGWDGSYKGKPADVGVFGWYLKVKCFNGEETFRKGNVTLIR